MNKDLVRTYVGFPTLILPAEKLSLLFSLEFESLLSHEGDPDPTFCTMPFLYAARILPLPPPDRITPGVFSLSAPGHP